MLQLHVPSLLAVTLIVDMTLGVFCLACWLGRQNRQIYFWLSMSSIASATGCFLLMMRGNWNTWLTVWCAQTLILLACSLLWVSIRTFELRPARLYWIVAGPVVWSIFCCIPAIFAQMALRSFLSSVLIACYFLAITVDLLRAYGKDAARSRLIAGCVSAFHLMAALARVSVAFFGMGSNWPNEPASNLVGIFVIESLVSVVCIVLSFSMMERDRAEAEQRKAASTDVLTGAMSRRAFLDTSMEWIERKGKDAALLLFDLDHFKKINDTFGHAAGDAVLVAFAKLVSERIEIANIIAGFNVDAASSNQYPRWYETTLADAAEGGEPIFGRLGGEEFACLLPHLSQAQGLAIAEDIRSGLQSLDIRTGGQQIEFSVSASVVTTADIGHRLDMMLSSADHALYRAKHNGRNRVEAGTAEPGMRLRHFA